VLQVRITHLGLVWVLKAEMGAKIRSFCTGLGVEGTQLIFKLVVYCIFIYFFPFQALSFFKRLNIMLHIISCVNCEGLPLASKLLQGHFVEPQDGLLSHQQLACTLPLSPRTYAFPQRNMHKNFAMFSKRLKLTEPKLGFGSCWFWLRLEIPLGFVKPQNNTK
jgi:hypothetical protein